MTIRIVTLKEQAKMYPVIQKQFPVNLKQMNKFMNMIPELE